MAGDEAFGMISSVERIWLLRPFLKVLEKRSTEKHLCAQLDECVKLIWRDPRGHGLNLEQVAVLCPTHEGLNPFRRALEERDIPICLPAHGTPLRLADASVKLLTVASAKGLDFPIVYLVRVTDYRAACQCP